MNRSEAIEKITGVIGDTEAAGRIADALGYGEKQDGAALVIICNRGVHAIDEARLPDGKVFYASQGNLAMDNAGALGLSVEAALLESARVLKEYDWRRVYIVPSGLPVLAIALAAMIHQIKVFPPVVLQYDRETGEYWPMEFEIRRLASQA